MKPDDYKWLYEYADVVETELDAITDMAKTEVHSQGVVSRNTTHNQARLSRLLKVARGRFSMARTMYDSTDPTIIPADAEVVAYYPHAWGTNIEHFKNALIVRIDNRGDHADDCHILDVESGAASIATAHEWVMSWHKLHPDGLVAINGWIRKPVLYCSESMLGNLRTQLSGLDYDVWGANWSTGQAPIAGCFAKQYTNKGPHGENYDMSLVFDDTWGHKPAAPTPPPAPKPAPKPASRAALLVWGVGDDVCSWKEVHSDDNGATWH